MTRIEEAISELAGGRITRREFVHRAAALGLSASAIGAVLAACGKKADEATTTGAKITDTTKPDKIYLYNWSDYMSPKVLKGFQAQTGIKVVETYFEDNDTLLAKLSAGATGYDVIVPTDWMVSIMTKSDLLQPLDMSLIPNFTNVMKKFQSPPYDPGTGGKKYSVPYMFGSTGIGVRTDKVSEPVTSWASMWDPAYKGQIVMLNDPRGCICTALLLLGLDPNSTDDGELQQAKEKLIEQKPLVLKYDAVPLRVVMAGNPLTECWDGDIVKVRQEQGEDVVQYVLPEEGFMYWSDCFAVPKGAPSPYGAALFLDYLLQPANAAECSNFTGYQTACQAAVDLIKDPILKAMRPDDETMSRGSMYEDLGEYNRTYNKIWAEVKSA